VGVVVGCGWMQCALIVAHVVMLMVSVSQALVNLYHTGRTKFPQESQNSMSVTGINDLPDQAQFPKQPHIQQLILICLALVDAHLQGLPGNCALWNRDVVLQAIWCFEGKLLAGGCLRWDLNVYKLANDSFA